MSCVCVFVDDEPTTKRAFADGDKSCSGGGPSRLLSTGRRWSWSVSVSESVGCRRARGVWLQEGEARGCDRVQRSFLPLVFFHLSTALLTLLPSFIVFIIRIVYERTNDVNAIYRYSKFFNDGDDIVASDDTTAHTRFLADAMRMLVSPFLPHLLASRCLAPSVSCLLPMGVYILGREQLQRNPHAQKTCSRRTPRSSSVLLGSADTIWHAI